ncbi:hypothetical protein HPB50_010836 [Hyalomma asiaticum]|uniref:Uncharacterized protein n=1 Tax=Hyalomma asiaticum TaxID=266040 RepID=A0ACB7RN33_HYAAI|nr:hypothetical protein HPB50_010836 [Hyalomma asiaticum]
MLQLRPGRFHGYESVITMLKTIEGNDFQAAKPTATTKITPSTTRPPHAVEPMPLYAYLCTVSYDMDTDPTYLPPDGMCDYLFYDSLYLTDGSRLTDGFHRFRPGLQRFIQQASNYSKTMFGVWFCLKG